MEDRKVAGEQEVLMTITLLAIVLTVFALIITIDPSLLKHTIFSVQLVLSIPLLLAASLGRAKLASTGDQRWDNFGYIYWTLGYGCFVNTLGILLAYSVSPLMALIFFGANILIPLSFSWVATYIKPETLLTRMKKDAFFISIIILFGLLPALGTY